MRYLSKPQSTNDDKTEPRSFLRQLPGKSQQLTGGDGDGVELGLSMLSAADWARQGDDVRSIEREYSLQFLCHIG